MKTLPLSLPAYRPALSVEQLSASVDLLRAELGVVQQIVLAINWLSRDQAMLLLGIGSTKLWQLKQQNIITADPAGGKYSLQSCIAYLSRSHPGLDTNKILLSFYSDPPITVRKS